MPMCAHTKIDYFKVHNSNGTYSDKWMCKDCGHRFIPIMPTSFIDKTPGTFKNIFRKWMSNIKILYYNKIQQSRSRINNITKSGEKIPSINSQIPTCDTCGEEMKYNVPRLGPNGGFIHSKTNDILCSPNITTGKLPLRPRIHRKNSQSLKEPPTIKNYCCQNGTFSKKHSCAKSNPNYLYNFQR